jgi:hypothetical protein
MGKVDSSTSPLQIFSVVWQVILSHNRADTMGKHNERERERPVAWRNQEQRSGQFALVAGNLLQGLWDEKEETVGQYSASKKGRTWLVILDRGGSGPIVGGREGRNNMASQNWQARE